MAHVEEVLGCPVSSPAAPAPPADWDRLRRKCPVASITFPSGAAAAPLTRYDDAARCSATGSGMEHLMSSRRRSAGG